MAGPYYQNSKVDDVDYIEAADLEAIEAGFASVDEDKAEIAIPATPGDFATLTAAGNLADSGKTPPSGEVVGDTDAQTLTNKTLTSPTINGASMSGTVSAPSGTWAVGAGVTLSGVVNLTGAWQRNGVAITATAAEINMLDGLTTSLAGLAASAAELNILDGALLSTAELNILNGITASTAELNVLDGVTASAVELNILDGITATTSELNILDGVTATTAEINALSGVSGTVVTTTATQALTNKTLTAPTLTSPRGTRVATGATLNLAAGDVFTYTVAGNTTLALSNVPASGNSLFFVLELTNGGAYTVTWWANLNWPLGVPPTLTITGRDILHFYTWDGGSTWNGVLVGKAMG